MDKNLNVASKNGNEFSINQFKKFRKNQPKAKELIEGILSHNITCLSRAISIVESNNENHISKANEIINACLPHANKSVRIGITGIPGVGKSTFIEAFGKYLTGIGKKVAVLAIDPSSSISKGSILADKTRMEQLVIDKNAYIRPSAARTTLGGVARKTRESIILCEAAGFNIIIIETVGVGQNEIAVHSMVDFFLLLGITGAGDEIQGIKRGIIEMADAVIINKSDGDNVMKSKFTQKEFERALRLYPQKKSDWTPIVSTCSSLNKEKIDNVWHIISDYMALVQSNNYFTENRKQQNHYWMLETIDDQLKHHFYNHPLVTKLLQTNKQAVANNEISPFDAAQNLLEAYFKYK